MWYDMSEHTLVAPGFRTWFEQFANDLEAGHSIYDEDEGGRIRSFDD